jgi:hypothetical protein
MTIKIHNQAQYSALEWQAPMLATLHMTIFLIKTGFTAWTANNKLRHPRYLGLRNDKAATEIIRKK